MTHKKSALGSTLLIYFVLNVLLITLIPFDFRKPETVQISVWTDFDDFITNIFLFIPVGFLFVISKKNCRGPLCFHALGFGIFLSLGIEVVQIFVHGRSPSVIDVFTNGTGAWIGAVSAKYIQSRMGSDWPVTRLTWNLPLINIVYLLIPLMWLNCLATGNEKSRLWLLLLPGLFGAGGLSAIYLFQFKRYANHSPNRLSLVTLGWFMMASIPALTIFPIQIVAFGIGLCLLIQVPARLIQTNRMEEKRFELPALKMLLPLFVIYLLLLALWPTTQPLADWQTRVDFLEFTFDKRMVFTFRFIEIIAAFTLLGYIISEMRGRKKESFFETFGWIYLIALCASVVMALLRSFPPPFEFNVLEMALIVGASLYGALIYRLQLKALKAKKQPARKSGVAWRMPAF